MAHLLLTADDVARLLVAEGATGWTVVTMGAICAAESGRDAYAVNVNHAPGQAWHRSLDVGMFQVNTFFNSTQKISELLDPEWNTTIALKILADAGGPPVGYMRWNAYRNGMYRPYLPECRDAANRIGVKV
jgi:Lysozyme like domain